MNETQTKIVAAVDKIGGVATWEQAIADLDLRERERALREMRGLEKQGVLKRVNRFDAETKQVTFTIEKVS